MDKIIDTETVGRVSLYDLILEVVNLKRRALLSNDKDLYFIANDLEHSFILLMDTHNIFERGW